MKAIWPNGWPSIAATVSASTAASGGPSTVPHDTADWVRAEPGWTKRAMRTTVDDYRPCPIRERPSPLGHTVAVRSSLSTIPVATRRRGSVGLAGFALLSTVVGVLAIVDGHAALVTVGVLAVLAAAVIALAAWGMWQSVRLDVATARLDDGGRRGSRRTTATRSRAAADTTTTRRRCTSPARTVPRTAPVRPAAHTCQTCVLTARPLALSRADRVRPGLRPSRP